MSNSRYRKGRRREDWDDLDLEEVMKILDRKKRESYVRENGWIEETPDGLEYVDNVPGYVKPSIESLLSDKKKLHIKRRTYSEEDEEERKRRKREKIDKALGYVVPIAAGIGTGVEGYLEDKRKFDALKKYGHLDVSPSIRRQSLIGNILSGLVVTGGSMAGVHLIKEMRKKKRDEEND